MTAYFCRPLAHEDLYAMLGDVVRRNRPKFIVLDGDFLPFSFLDDCCEVINRTVSTYDICTNTYLLSSEKEISGTILVKKLEELIKYLRSGSPS
jgi:hypothetical protein